MSNVIPKDKQSAYERWELASFGDARPGAQAKADVKQYTQAQVAQLVDQQVNALRDVAREEGIREGYAAGYDEGHRAGFAAGRAEADRQAALLSQIATVFRGEVERADTEMAEELMNLALDLSKAMLKAALKVRPELLLPVVSEAVRYLPTVQQPARLFLHPQDIDLVREHMGDELSKGGWRIEADAAIAPGGCRVETASNQVDATAETRWQRIAEALGRDSSWLA